MTPELQPWQRVMLERIRSGRRLVLIGPRRRVPLEVIIAARLQLPPKDAAK